MWENIKFWLAHEIVKFTIAMTILTIIGIVAVVIELKSKKK